MSSNSNVNPQNPILHPFKIKNINNQGNLLSKLISESRQQNISIKKQLFTQPLNSKGQVPTKVVIKEKQNQNDAQKIEKYANSFRSKIIQAAINQKKLTVQLQTKFQFTRKITFLSSTLDTTIISPIIQGRKKVLNDNIKARQQYLKKQQQSNKSKREQRKNKYFYQGSSEIDFKLAIKDLKQQKIDNQFIFLIQKRIREINFKQLQNKSQLEQIYLQILYLLLVVLKIQTIPPTLISVLNKFLIEIQKYSSFLSIHFLNFVSQLQKHQFICFQIIHHHLNMTITQYQQKCKKQSQIMITLSEQLPAYQNYNYRNIFMKMFQKLLQSYLDKNDIQQFERLVSPLRYIFNAFSYSINLIGNMILKNTAYIETLVKFAIKVINELSKEQFIMNVSNLLNILQSGLQRESYIDDIVTKFVMKINKNEQITLNMMNQNKISKYGLSISRIIVVLTTNFTKHQIEYHIRFLELVIQLEQKISNENIPSSYEHFKEYLMRIIFKLSLQPSLFAQRQINLLINTVSVLLKDVSNVDQVSENIIIIILKIIQSNKEAENQYKIKSQIKTIKILFDKQNRVSNQRIQKIKILFNQILDSNHQTIASIKPNQIDLYLLTLHPFTVYTHQNFKTILYYFFTIINKFPTTEFSKTQTIGIFALKITQFLKINNFPINQLLYQPKIYTCISDIIWSVYIYRILFTRLIKEHKNTYNININQVFNPYFKYNSQISSQKCNISKIIYCTQILCLMNVGFAKKIITIDDQRIQSTKCNKINESKLSSLLSEILVLSNECFERLSEISTNFQKQLSNQFKISYQKSLFQKFIPQQLNGFTIFQILWKISLIKQYINLFVVVLVLPLRLDTIKMDKILTFLEFIWENFIQKHKNNQIMVEIANKYQQNIYNSNETKQLSQLLPKINQKTLKKDIYYIRKNVMVLPFNKNAQRIMNRLTINWSKQTL